MRIGNYNVDVILLLLFFVFTEKIRVSNRRISSNKSGQVRTSPNESERDKHEYSNNNNYKERIIRALSFANRQRHIEPERRETAGHD